MATIDYFFVIQQDQQKTLAKIVEIDASNEAADVQKTARELKDQHPRSTIHYIQHSRSDKAETMRQFES